MSLCTSDLRLYRSEPLVTPTQSLWAVVYELLAKHLAELVSISARGVAAVDIILHVLEETLVCSIDTCNASRCNITVDG
jgi:hypothetical protein